MSVVEGQRTEAPASAAPAPEAASSLAAAQQQLASGKPALCLALLAALPPGERQHLAARQVQTLCHIRLAGSPGATSAWWQVSGRPGLTERCTINLLMPPCDRLLLL